MRYYFNKKNNQERGKNVVMLESDRSKFDSSLEMEIYSKPEKLTSFRFDRFR